MTTDVPPPLEVAPGRRIFGLETEFGLHLDHASSRRVTSEEVAGALFHSVVQWGRSSNVFLPNGSRLYIDVGAHPEYATAECDSIQDLIALDKAGERIVGDLVAEGEARLAEAGIEGQIHLYKNNSDSSGNSYGCHENYLVRRRADFAGFVSQLIPFLVTRQILTGAGCINGSGQTAKYCFSVRSDHMWEAMSSATTRSRPMINTRDEPHAHADLYRRMHVIVGDSNLAEPTVMLKVGSMDLLLRIAETGTRLPQLTLAREMQSIREISRDLTGRAAQELESGRHLTAVQMQREFLEFAEQHVGDTVPEAPDDRAVLDLWRRGLDAVESGDYATVDTELEWAIKLRLIERYRERSGAALDSAAVARLEYAYHDVAPGRGLYASMAEQGLVRAVVDPARVEQAKTTPPATTRAALRGRFVAAGVASPLDFTADWTHLKIVGEAGRTVMVKDPFRAEDDRVDALIEHLRASAGDIE